MGTLVAFPPPFVPPSAFHLTPSHHTYPCNPSQVTYYPISIMSDVMSNEAPQTVRKDLHCNPCCGVVAMEALGGLYRLTAIKYPTKPIMRATLGCCAGLIGGAICSPFFVGCAVTDCVLCPFAWCCAESTTISICEGGDKFSVLFTTKASNGPGRQFMTTRPNEAKKPMYRPYELVLVCGKPQGRIDPFTMRSVFKK